MAADLKLVPEGAAAGSDLTVAAGSAPVSAGPPVDGRPSAAQQQLKAAFGALFESSHPDVYQCVEETLERLAFARAGENQVQAARVRGITRNTLRTLLKRHGLLADSAPARAQNRAATGVLLTH